VSLDAKVPEIGVMLQWSTFADVLTLLSDRPARGYPEPNLGRCSDNGSQILLAAMILQWSVTLVAAPFSHRYSQVIDTGHVCPSLRSKGALLLWSGDTI